MIETVNAMGRALEAFGETLRDPAIVEQIQRASRGHITSEATAAAAIDAVVYHLSIFARSYRDLALSDAVRHRPTLPDTVLADTAQAILTPDDTLPTDLPRSEPCNDPECCPEADQ